MLEVEVRGLFNQFYKVFLHNILEDVAEISVKNDSKSTLSIPLSFVFKTLVTDCPQLKSGDDIEVYIQLNAPIPVDSSNRKLSNTDYDVLSKLAVAKNQLAWWPAQVQNIRGDYLVVRIAGIANCTDVVDKTIVRSIVPCTDDLTTPRTGEVRRPLDSRSLFKRILHIPHELSQCCKDVSAYQNLLRYCKSPPTLHYDEQKSQLLIFAFDADVIRQVEVLEDTYLKMMRQKWNLMQSMNNATKRLESTRLANNKSANFVESFSIPKVCMGLAIGSKGVTIQQARQIDNVVAIDVCDETCIFVIFAKTKEAIVAARKIIEFSEAVVQVPQALVARIIGKSGSNIQTMVDKSGVIRVRIENNQFLPDGSVVKRPVNSTDDKEGLRNNSEPLSRKVVDIESREYDNTEKEDAHALCSNKEFVNFVFIGTIESINNAKLLISFQVETLQELDMIQAEKAEIMRELHTVESQNSSQYAPSAYPPTHKPVRNGPQHQLTPNPGNHRMMHPMRFAPRDDPFYPRNHGNSPRYAGRYPPANGAPLYEHEYGAAVANDEYSLAPGGPPSGSQQRGRYNNRGARERSTPLKADRDGYPQPSTAKADNRKPVPRRGDVASGARGAHRASNVENDACGS